MQFLLYCVCGCIGVSTDYFIYYTTLNLGMWYQAANVLGYLSGTLISFFLNRKITFRVQDNLLRRLALFFGVAVVGYIASALLLWVLVDLYLLDAKLAKLFTLPVVVIIQFSLNRHLTFRARETVS